MQAPFTPIPTGRAELDAQVQRLRGAARRFAKLEIQERLRLLEQIAEGYFAQLDDMVEAACHAKGLDAATADAGEDWLAHGFAIARYLRLLRAGLQDVASHGAPQLDPKRLRKREGGGLALSVYPASNLESLTFPGIRAEVYFERGLGLDELRSRQARFYRQPHDGRVALVLGAGNVASIPPKDALQKLFVDGEVCLLKMNPVNEYLGPFLERAFAPAIEAGYFAVTYGGAEVGGYLVEHPAIDSVHITGSDRTHDTIVWGPAGPERTARVAANTPLLKKEITSELGNVSAILVVPGPWSPGDFEYQARNLAGMVTNNASFNCNAAKLLVQPRNWAGSGQLLTAVEHALARTPTRRAYYPGASDRYQRFTSGRRLLREVGVPEKGHLPWAIVPHLDPEDRAEPLFRSEPWCSVLGETQVGSDDPADFLDRATDFVNERVWGTLNVGLLIHPATARLPGVAAALERAIERLRYGTVAVNLWPAAGFTLGCTPWGAHPSSTLADIQSGRG